MTEELVLVHLTRKRVFVAREALRVESTKGLDCDRFVLAGLRDDLRLQDEGGVLDHSENPEECVVALRVPQHRVLVRSLARHLLRPSDPMRDVAAAWLLELTESHRCDHAARHRQQRPEE